MSIHARSGRDVVLQISPSRLEALVLARFRAEMSCISPVAAAILGIPVPAFAASVGVYPVAFALRPAEPAADGHPARAARAELTVVTTHARSADRRRTISSKFEDLLANLTLANFALVPSDLSAFAALDARVTGGPYYKVLGDGGLAVAFDLDRGETPDEDRWNAYDEDLRDGRDWALAIDRTVVQAFLAGQLFDLREASHHDGSIIGAEGPGYLDVLAFDREEGLRRVGRTLVEGRFDEVVSGYLNGASGYEDVLLYDRTTGAAQVYAGDGHGGFERRSPTSIAAGFDALRASKIGDTPVIFGYRASGKLVVHQIRASGSLRALPEVNVPSGADLVVGPAAGDARIVIVRSSDHLVSVRVDPDGSATALADVDDNVQWDVVLGVRDANRDSVFAYRRSDGRYRIRAFAADGSSSIAAESNIDRGFDRFVTAYDPYTRADVLVGYRANIGQGIVYDLSGGLVLRDRFYFVRVGYDRFTRGRFDAGTIAAYDRSAAEPEIALERLDGTWGSPIVVAVRGQYHAPVCGDLDFEATATVTASIANGTITYAKALSEPDLDFWDGAKLVLCATAILGPVGTGLGIAAAEGAFTPDLSDRIVLPPPPPGRFDLPGGVSLVGTALDTSVDLVVRGRVDLTAPLAPSLRVFPFDEPWFTATDDGHRAAFYEDGDNVCRRGLGVVADRELLVRNLGPGPLALCAIDLAPGSDPGFVLRSVGFPPRAQAGHPRIAVGNGGVTGLPTTLRTSDPELLVRIGFQGSLEADAAATLRILSGDPTHPEMLIDLAYVSGYGAEPPTYEPKQVVLSVANTEAGLTPHAFTDCRLGDLTFVQDERPSGGFTVRNPGSRPVYLCGVGVTDPDDVFEVSAPRLVPPGGEAYVSVAYFPKTVGALSTGQVRLNVSAGPDIVVPLRAQVVAEPGRATAQIGISAATLEYIYDHFGQQLCVPNGAELCRVRDLYEPRPPGGIVIGMYAVRGVAPGRPVEVRDRSGEVVAVDVDQRPVRNLALPLPGDGQGPYDPCVASAGGDRFHVGVGGRVLVPSARLDTPGRPVAVAGRDGFVVAGGPEGFVVADWRDPGAPKVVDQYREPITGLGLVRDRLYAAVGDRICTFAVDGPRLERIADVALGAPIATLAADRTGVYAIAGGSLVVIRPDGARARCDVPEGAAWIGILRGAVYVGGRAALAWYDEALSVVDTVSCGPIDALDHYGNQVLVYGPEGTTVVEPRGKRWARIGWLRGRHWASGWVPDREHRRLYALDARGLYLVDVRVHKLDRERVPYAPLRIRPKRAR